MKKILCLCLVLLLVGCGANNTPQETTEPDSQEEQLSACEYFVMTFSKPEAETYYITWLEDHSDTVKTALTDLHPAFAEKIQNWVVCLNPEESDVTSVNQSTMLYGLEVKESFTSTVTLYVYEGGIVRVNHNGYTFYQLQSETTTVE